VPTKAVPKQRKPTTTSATEPDISLVETLESIPEQRRSQPETAREEPTAVVAPDEVVAPEENSDAVAVPTRRRNRVARAAWYFTVVVLAAFLVTAAIWTVTGGRSYVVTTPSMSPMVPVGSLVLTRPVPPGGPKVGQIIAFHPPNEPGTTYTHRVVKIMPGPVYSTKGDLDTTPDAWVLTRKNILGVATHHFKRVGWLVRALPWLALGAVVLIGLAAVMPRRRRRVTYFVGATIVVSIPILILRPLVRGVFAGSGLIHGRIHAMVVNTGLLPLRLVMNGATTQHTAPGYPTTLIAKPPKSGHVLITGTVDLGFWGWLILVLICLAPLIIALTVPRKYWDGDDVVPVTDADTDADADTDLDAQPEPAPQLT
jgi:signal peptidase I